MAKRDFYQVLGVSRSASEKEVRQAFRRLARQHHPDVNPGDSSAEAKFKEINEAYEVLSNAESRAKYDRYGAGWKHAEQYERAHAGAQGPSTWRWNDGPGRGRVTVESFGIEDEDDPFASIFDTFAGGRTRFAGTRRRAGPARGQDVEHAMEVTLEEAYQGATRLLRIEGAGGSSRRLEVKIPAGVQTGSRVRIAGEGGPGSGPGAAKGDLYLAVAVAPHPRFERRGDDLHADVEVPLAEAVLGGEASVPTLSGRRIALKVPPETQNGRTFRLAGQGMPRLGSPGRGDLYAKVRVVLPTGLSQRERQLFEELRALRAS